MGDIKYQSYDGYGIDVASVRQDDIDKISIEHIKAKNDPKVLDLGSGAGGHSVRLAGAGAIVTSVDSFDFSKKFEKIRGETGLTEDRLLFRQGNLASLEEVLEGHKFDDAYCQRTIHYVAHYQTVRTLKFLKNVVADKLFISVTGLNSEIGQGYVDKNKKVQDRFANLSADSQKKFHVCNPVCIYQKEEFIEVLEEAGWKVDRCWESAFGNIKAIAK